MTMTKKQMKIIRVLVTGGAGFIGSHLVDQLTELGYSVIIVDCLDPQIHPHGNKPDYLNDKAHFVKADIRTPGVLESVVKGVDVIFHLASSTAVGQSAHRIKEYSSNNIYATSMLWDVLANTDHCVKKVILASSRAVYGEGVNHCQRCDKVFTAQPRLEVDLQNGLWDVRCPHCHNFTKPVHINEEAVLNPVSIYAITKNTQEQISRCCSRILNIPTVILRLSNVYGDRQSISNPYVGISSIFASNILNNRPVEVFEDGLESRDFVYVKDVIKACLLAMDDEKANNCVFNVGSGEVISILDVANKIIEKMSSNIKPHISGRYRMGDVRHILLDISLIRRVLDYLPAYDFDQGIERLVQWILNDEPAEYYK